MRAFQICFGGTILSNQKGQTRWIEKSQSKIYRFHIAIGSLLNELRFFCSDLVLWLAEKRWVARVEFVALTLNWTLFHHRLHAKQFWGTKTKLQKTIWRHWIVKKWLIFSIPLTLFHLTYRITHSCLKQINVMLNLLVFDLTVFNIFLILEQLVRSFV